MYWLHAFPGALTRHPMGTAFPLARHVLQTPTLLQWADPSLPSVRKPGHRRKRYERQDGPQDLEDLSLGLGDVSNLPPLHRTTNQAAYSDQRLTFFA